MGIMITIEDFDKIDMRIGTIVEASVNKRARKPAYRLVIDFGGELGVKMSSAQVTACYQPEDLVGRQVVGVVNFPSIRIGDVKSEVLVLGSDSEQGIVLLGPSEKVKNGDRIC